MCITARRCDMDPQTRPPTSVDGRVAPVAATIRLVHDLRSLCGHESPLALLFDKHMSVTTAGCERRFTESSAHLSAAGDHGRNPIDGEPEIPPAEWPRTSADLIPIPRAGLAS